MSLNQDPSQAQGWAKSERMEAAAKVAADVRVGTPPGPLSDLIMRKVHFHGFEGLPTARGAAVKSPEFSCFGHQWVVDIYPGGFRDSNEGYVSVNLYNASPESVQAYFKFLAKHPTDPTLRFQSGSGDKMDTFGAKGKFGELINGWGISNFAERETLLTYLNKRDAPH
ncbi:hypothetical protein THAOC_27937 [Thalassiosira oceanica]|uniref:MATH domain-containing protein n=1 Tax=Thalassiosira oceanica TaxID=159749 RepID=K0RVB9_THAOC|nr:hypothetical protein THAOC_27937 [Thalassiosira oceanica]|eukprot:EJK52761.1 hypothetical protein THAOC_27937 [Thalassiosira oceanica]